MISSLIIQEYIVQYPCLCVVSVVFLSQCDLERCERLLALYLLRVDVWSRKWCVLEKVPCVECVLCLSDGNVLYISIKSI